MTEEIDLELMWAEMGSKLSQNMKGCGMLFSQELAALPQADDLYLAELASLLGSAQGILETRAK